MAEAGAGDEAGVPFFHVANAFRIALSVAVASNTPATYSVVRPAPNVVAWNACAWDTVNDSSI